uniref:Uncharacterized protein n=1 Tax=Glossina palpalis gambiensis TaxID=67801 RepID=A0A1B0AU07_9MUSC
MTSSKSCGYSDHLCGKDLKSNHCTKGVHITCSRVNSGWPLNDHNMQLSQSAGPFAIALSISLRRSHFCIFYLKSFQVFDFEYRDLFLLLVIELFLFSCNQLPMLLLLLTLWLNAAIAQLIEHTQALPH